MLGLKTRYLIHSKSKSPEDILEFAKGYQKLCRGIGKRKPLICVPTTYNMITEGDLKKAGFDLVIYANHMLRASVKAMEEVGKLILKNERALETDPYCAPVKQVFEMVGFEEVKRKDIENEEARIGKLGVIIPAAGEHPGLKPVLGDKPCCMLEINGKPILERQLGTLKKFPFRNINVIRGYQKEKVSVPGVKYFDNNEYGKTSVLTSLMLAREQMGEGFIYINSDVIFDGKIIRKLIQSEDDIVIVIDSSYKYHKHDVEKKLDLVVTKHRDHSLREVKAYDDNALRIGKGIAKELASGEFVGIAKFSKDGAANLKKVFLDCQKNHDGRFHEAESFGKAGITDMLQELIDRGFRVSVIEVFKGWIEIHNEDDYRTAKEIL